MTVLVLLVVLLQLLIFLQLLQQGTEIEEEEGAIPPPRFSAHFDMKAKVGCVRNEISEDVITHPLIEVNKKLSPRINLICLKFRSLKLTWLSMCI